MAFAVIPDTAELSIAQWLASALGSEVEVHLYTNDVTPDEDTVYPDLTTASYPDYDNQLYSLLSPAEVGGKAEFGSQTITFSGPTSGGPVDIYGWYMFYPGDLGANIIMAARLASAPRTLNDDTETITLVINWRLFDAHQP